MARLSHKIEIDDVWYFEPNGLGETVECTVRAMSADIITISFNVDQKVCYQIVSRYRFAREGVPYGKYIDEQKIVTKKYLFGLFSITQEIEIKILVPYK